MGKVDYKIKKYEKKLSEYPCGKNLIKLSEYVLLKYYNQMGGSVIEIAYDDENMETSIKGIKSLIDETFQDRKKLNGTTKSYMMIVMGATGSGKTDARKVGYKIVQEVEKTRYGKNWSVDQIEESFIDISVDNYVYGLKTVFDGEREITGRDYIKETVEAEMKEKETFQELLAKYNKEKTAEMKNRIKELSKKAFLSYIKARDCINHVPMVMLFLALHFKLNFIFETVHGRWIIDTLIKNLHHYTFPIIVYPSVTKANLIPRILGRAATEYRLIDEGLLESAIEQADNMFRLIIEEAGYIASNIRDIVAIKYDNNTRNTAAHIASNEFGSIDQIQTYQRYDDTTIEEKFEFV